jgi:hypothetical protein
MVVVQIEQDKQSIQTKIIRASDLWRKALLELDEAQKEKVCLFLCQMFVYLFVNLLSRGNAVKIKHLVAWISPSIFSSFYLKTNILQDRCFEDVSHLEVEFESMLLLAQTQQQQLQLGHGKLSSVFIVAPA